MTRRDISAGRILSSALALLPRALPRLLLVSLLLMVVGALVLAGAVAIAAPAAPAVVGAIVDGSGIAVLALFGAGLWFLVPVVVMLLTGLLYLGMSTYIADARYAEAHLTVGDPWLRSLARAGTVLATLAVIVTVFLALVVVAPLISVAALVLVVGPSSWRDRAVPRLARDRRALAWLIVPFAAAVLAVVRWSLAPTIAFVSRTQVRRALRASRALTADAVRPVGAAVVIAVLGSAILNQGAAVLTSLSGNGWAEIAVLVVVSAVVAPIPAFTTVVAYRMLRGEPSDALVEREVAARSRRRLLPAALGATLVVTLMSPVSPASAAPVPEEPDLSPAAVVSLTATVELHTPQNTFPVFGDDDTVVRGRVVGDPAGPVPSGFVRVVGIFNGEQRTFTDPVAVDGSGSYEFPRTTLRPLTSKYWVEYLGDASYGPASSAERAVTVQKRSLNGLLERIAPIGAPRVGDTVTFRYTVDWGSVPGGPGSSPSGDPADDPARTPDAVPGAPVEGVVEVYAGPDYAVIAQAPVVDGVAIVQFVVAQRSMRYLVALESPLYFSTPESSENGITASAAAATTTTFAVQQLVASGETLLTQASVTRPPGVNLVGHFDFYQGDLTSRVLVATRDVPANGTLAQSFCVASAGSDDCAGATVPVITAATADMRMHVVFRPDPEHEPDRSLVSSTSPISSVAVAPRGSLGSGECILVDLSGFVRGPHSAGPDDITRTVGSSRVVERSNCGVPHNSDNVLTPGYRVGTVLTLRATALPGWRVQSWAVDGTVIGSGDTVFWRIPDEGRWFTDVVTTYEPACVAVDVVTVGSGRPWDTRTITRPEPFATGPFEVQECAHVPGATMVLPGATVDVSVEARDNTVTQEVDRFYRATVNGSPAETRSCSGRTCIRFTAQQSNLVVAEFGPQCRAVVPAEGDDGTVRIITEPNCVSPTGVGYRRGSQVEVEADTASNPYAVPSGWVVDGAAQPALGTDSRATVTVGMGAEMVVGFEVGYCYPIAVDAAGAGAQGSALTRSTIEVAPAPNCSDGSDRWAEGTQMVLTPRPSTLSGPAVQLGAWTDRVRDADGGIVENRVTAVNFARNSGAKASSAPVSGYVQTGGTRTFTVTEQLDITGHFYRPEECSEVRFSGALDLSQVSMPDTGCGPGRYWDAAAAAMPANGLYEGSERRSNGEETGNRVRDVAFGPQYYLYDTARHPFTELTFSVLGTDLDVEGTVQLTETGPLGRWTVRDTADLFCRGDRCTAMVRGDVTVRMDECQRIEPVVRFVIAGDETNTLYSPEDFGLEGIDWLSSDTPGCSNGGWLPGSRVLLHGESPSVGFEFLEWGEVDNVLTLEATRNREVGDTRSPWAVRVQMDNQTPVLTAELLFRLHCSDVTLGGSIAIVEPAPNCGAGGGEGVSRYVIGTYLMVAAQTRNANGRYFEGFRGAIAGTRGVVEATSSTFAVRSDNARHAWQLDTRLDYPAAYALVDAPTKHVEGYFQHSDNGWEAFVSTLPKAGKFMVGVVAVAAGAAVNLCPPCAGALAALQVTEFLVRLLPGGDFLGNILAMINPTNLLTCIAGWGFDKLDGTEKSTVTEMQAGRAGGTIASGILAKTAKEYAVNRPQLRSFMDKGTKTAKVGGTAIAFAQGIVENEVWDFNWSGANREELRDTAAFESCVGNTYGNPVPQT